MPHTVLLVGGTGRTGVRVLEQLLRRNVAVRAIVRTTARVPPSLRAHPALSLVEGEILALPDAALEHHVAGCDAVVSCLGHTISMRGVFGPPHDLVTRAVARLCDAVRAARPERPVRFVLLSSVSVDHPGGVDTRRAWTERALLRVLLALVPPTRDNQRAAETLYATGPADPCVQWVVVRPDSLLAGDAGEYAPAEELRIPLFRPASTRMANVAHFMSDLVTDPATWAAWRGKLPVIVDVPVPAAAAAVPARRAG